MTASRSPAPGGSLRHRPPRHEVSRGHQCRIAARRYAADDHVVADGPPVRAISAPHPQPHHPKLTHPVPGLPQRLALRNPHPVRIHRPPTSIRRSPVRAAAPLPGPAPSRILRPATRTAQGQRSRPPPRAAAAMYRDGRFGHGPQRSRLPVRAGEPGRAAARHRPTGCGRRCFTGRARKPGRRSAYGATGSSGEHERGPNSGPRLTGNRRANRPASFTAAGSRGRDGADDSCACRVCQRLSAHRWRSACVRQDMPFSLPRVSRAKH